MRKKHLHLLLGGVLICTAVLGCGNKESNTFTDSNPSTTTNEIVEYQSIEDCVFTYMTDGTYNYDNYTFKYKLWIVSKNKDGKPIGSYVALSNKPEVTDDEIERLMIDSQLHAIDEIGYVVPGIYAARTDINIDENGRFIYNNKKYKDIMEISVTDKETGNKTLYSILTNDTKISYVDLIPENNVNTDKFVIIDKQDWN